MSPYRSPLVPPPDLAEEQAFADLALAHACARLGVLLMHENARGMTPRMQARIDAGEDALAVIDQLRPGGLGPGCTLRAITMRIGQGSTHGMITSLEAFHHTA